MSRESLGFKHVDGVIPDFKFWSTHFIQKVDLSIELLRKFEPEITEEVGKMEKVSLKSFTDHNDVKHKFEVDVYSIDYAYIHENGKRINGFIYIPCEKLDHFMITKKLERILNGR